jgi:hypothetical protein
LSRTLRWLLELTLPRHDDTTTRRKKIASHFDGFLPGSGGEPLMTARLFRHMVAAGSGIHIDVAYSARGPGHCGTRRVVVSSYRAAAGGSAPKAP